MPNKTLSVRDEDLPLWERAARAAERDRMTLSALVATALARHLGDTNTCSVLMYDDRDSSPRVEQFVGRWLTDAPPLASDERDREVLEAWGFTFGHRPSGGNTLIPTDWRTAVAETARGRIAVYLWHWNFDYDTPPEMLVFDTVDDAERVLGSDPRVRLVAYPSGFGTLWTDVRIALSKPTMGAAGGSAHSIVWRDI